MGWDGMGWDSMGWDGMGWGDLEGLLPLAPLYLGEVVELLAEGVRRLRLARNWVQDDVSLCPPMGVHRHSSTVQCPLSSVADAFCPDPVGVSISLR